MPNAEITEMPPLSQPMFVVVVTPTCRSKLGAQSRIVFKEQKKLK
jgi:hypothetical protein